MRKAILAALVAVLCLLPLTALAQTCASDLHYFEGRCLTDAEWFAWPPAVQPDPAPTPPVQPVYRGMGSGYVEQWRTMVAYYWGKHGATDRMLRIMRCESGGNPNAWNRSTDVRGLFQVRYPLWSKPWPGNYFDPWTNAAIAYQVWLVQGYRAWACKG